MKTLRSLLGKWRFTLATPPPHPHGGVPGGSRGGHTPSPGGLPKIPARPTPPSPAVLQKFKNSKIGRDSENACSLLENERLGGFSWIGSDPGKNVRSNKVSTRFAILRTAPNSKFQQNSVKRFHIFARISAKVHYFATIFIEFCTDPDEILSEFRRMFQKLLKKY